MTPTNAALLLTSRAIAIADVSGLNGSEGKRKKRW
jgi:hypothetical protein